MITREVVVKSDAGVHARPAMMLVRQAMKYGSCSVKLIKDDVAVDCKSIMSVLGLAIIAGSSLKITADGPGEEDIVNTLASMIESDFNISGD